MKWFVLSKVDLKKKVKILALFMNSIVKHKCLHVNKNKAEDAFQIALRGAHIAKSY